MSDEAAQHIYETAFLPGALKAALERSYDPAGWTVNIDDRARDGALLEALRVARIAAERAGDAEMAEVMAYLRICFKEAHAVAWAGVPTSDSENAVDDLRKAVDVYSKVNRMEFEL